MLLNICFGFIMLIASLIESLLLKGLWQKHNIQLANFDLASLRVIWFELGPLLGCRHIEMSRERAKLPGKRRRTKPEIVRLYGSRKSPLCRCTSITLPASL